MNLGQITSKLTPKGWLIVGGSLAATLLFVFFLFTMASKPSYNTLLAGVDPAQTGKITSTLSAQGIPYQLQNNGTAVAVPADQQAQARVALATAGLLTSSQPGYSLFDNQSLGQSNFQQKVTYQRALQGQLDQTIQGIQGVSSATVNLVLPDPTSQLFSNSGTASTASVLITDSGQLDPGSVRGIASLVANAVPGLSVSKVTITDQTGALLWPNGTTGGAGSPLEKQSAENAYDAQEAAQVEAMLAQTLGPGKAQVAVNADLNTNQTTEQSLKYATKGVPLSTSTTDENLTGGTGSIATGAAGLTATAGTAGNKTTPSKYSNKTTQTTYGVDKTVTNSQISAGTINRQSISVLLDKTVPSNEVPQVTNAVAAAVGLNKSRGDTLSVSQVAFAKPPAAATPSAPVKMIGYAKYVLVGIGALLFLFFMSRMLGRREQEQFAGQPTWVRELESPRSLASVEAAQLEPGDQPTRIMQLRPPVNVAKKQVEDLVEREPDRVAAQVRAWMAED
jgi:flagellar M-ring protein FliF